MTNRPTLFDKPDPQREAEADARAEADVREGRLVSHDSVKKWLSSWGTGAAWPAHALATDRVRTSNRDGAC